MPTHTRRRAFSAGVTDARAPCEYLYFARVRVMRRNRGLDASSAFFWGQTCGGLCPFLCPRKPDVQLIFVPQISSSARALNTAGICSVPQGQGPLDAPPSCARIR